MLGTDNDPLFYDDAIWNENDLSMGEFESGCGAPAAAGSSSSPAPPPSLERHAAEILAMHEASEALARQLEAQEERNAAERSLLLLRRR